MRVAGLQQVQFLGYIGVGVEVVLRLAGARYVRILGQLLQSDGAVVRAYLALLIAGIRVDRQEAGQDLTGGLASRNVGGGQREHRFLGATGLQGQVVRRLQDVLVLLGLGFGRVDRRLPEVLAGVVLVGGGHVVLGEQLALHLEQAFRVAHVAHQVAGDIGELVVLAGEDLLPCLDYRVGLIPYVQIHGTVVGVHGGLDRVADVVGLLRAQG